MAGGWRGLLDWVGYPVGRSPPSGGGFRGFLDWTGVPVGRPPAGGFPAQFDLLHVRYGGATTTLCVVATGDHNPAVPVRLRVRVSGVTREVYLVSIGDPNASSVTIRVDGATWAVRWYT